MNQRRLRIDRRFRGPPDSGNGGYVAGLLAEALGGSECTVTLRGPPPLDELLELRPTATGVELWSDELLAEAARDRLVMDIPVAPTIADALAAEYRFVAPAAP